jgi:hypothetical protein
VTVGSSSKGIRLCELLAGPHAAVAARVRAIVADDDRAGLHAWLGVEADPSLPIFAQVLADGPIRRALRARLDADCLREIWISPNSLIDDRLRDEAGDVAAVRLLADDPSLPFYLRAPGETAGRVSGKARRAAADALAGAQDLADLVAALRSGDGEVVLAQAFPATGRAA